MWILLKEGDVIRGGDEIAEGDLDHAFDWFPVDARDTWSHAGEIVGDDRVVRRKLTGWEAVKHALETEVLGNNKEGCETTKLFWGCGKCETGAVRQDRDWQCPECGAFNTEDIPARKAEVILKIMEE